VAVEADDGVVFLARLPDGPIIVLQGTAALIWAEACGPDVGGVVHRVAEQVGRDAADIEHVVDDFLDDLVEQGLLQSSG
jgi:hypothetical protein